MSKEAQLRTIRIAYEKKQKREKLEEAIKEDEKKLSMLKIGSEEWCILFAEIEYGKEMLENGDY